ncbi:flagellar biosynthesis anti-sigma factor FlgM [Virgibacillus sp. 7505]|uniref:flagellar biosynthesis anti-sigma factor FlgM n=1 Tax=Bacillaceae TaxID=186817 RepID=UPI000BA74C87|nr:flagellar biosynthesis anti-sigma factor FlgM [Virgibacillus sp. 7505]PAE15270.1 flagellar biosynthesis anti-sigma factor FlgM [Virgibacillus sp. 7505]
MKIQGPNQSGFNPYTKQLKQQADLQKASQRQDKLEISSEAKRLQEGDKIQASRQSHVEQIKAAVQNGEYKVDAEKTAKKMMDFWS